MHLNNTANPLIPSPISMLRVAAVSFVSICLLGGSAFAGPGSDGPDKSKAEKIMAAASGSATPPDAVPLDAAPAEAADKQAEQKEDPAEAARRALLEALDEADRLMASGEIARARRILNGIVSSSGGSEEALLASVALADLELRANSSETPEPAESSSVQPPSAPGAREGSLMANASAVQPDEPIETAKPSAEDSRDHGRGSMTPSLPSTSDSGPAAPVAAPMETAGRVESAAEARAKKYEDLAERLSSASRPSMLLRAGEAHLAAGNFERALAVFRRALEGADGKTLGAVYLGIAVACEKMDDGPGRQDALDKCAAMGGDAGAAAEKMLRLHRKGK